MSTGTRSSGSIVMVFGIGYMCFATLNKKPHDNGLEPIVMQSCTPRAGNKCAYMSTSVQQVCVYICIFFLPELTEGGGGGRRGGGGGGGVGGGEGGGCRTTHRMGAVPHTE